MFEKRGLSAVVTTLIIILLVLVSIGVVWVVVRNIVQEGSEQIDLGSFTLDLQIKKVEITDDDVTVTVYVKRNPGPGNFVGINFVFSDGSNSEVIREDSALAELEERSFTFTLNEINTSNLETISIAPIFKLSSGSESTGDFSDMFDTKKGVSIVTGTGGVINKFEKNGYSGFGRKEYTLSMGGDGDIVKFSKVVIDPLDVHLGDTQTFTAYVSSPNGITEVTTITDLDTSTLNLDLELQEDGEYSSSWTVVDTHDTTYFTTFIARDAVGNENNITLTWTDPTSCSTFLTHGSDSVITGNCDLVPNEINGLDSGKITINTGATVTLDSGSNFVWTPGYSLVVNGALIVSGGSGTKAYLHYYDSDDDLSGNGTYFVSSTENLSGSGYVRAVDDTGTTDCADDDSVVSTTRTQYDDDDGDTYTVNAGSKCLSASTWGNSACSTGGSTYAKNASSSCVRITASASVDCYDSNANAKPGQTTYFTTHRGDNSYDYNCDSGAETKNVSDYTSTCNTDGEPAACGKFFGGCFSSCSTSTSSTPSCGSSYFDKAGLTCEGEENCNDIDPGFCPVGSWGLTCVWKGGLGTLNYIGCR